MHAKLQYFILFSMLPACMRNTSTLDAASLEAGVDTSSLDTNNAPDTSARCAVPLQAPQTVMQPVPGELFYVQLGLGGLSMGESALVIAPNGQRVLIDVGNNSHANDIADAIQHFANDTSVDDVIITHYHADHGDGLDSLSRRITIRGHVIHRGRTDMTPAANEGTLKSVCSLGQQLGTGAIELCQAEGTASCDPTTWSNARPATACNGLAAAQRVWSTDSGMDFVAVNGIIANDFGMQSIGPLQTTDSNGENARSIVAVLRHGAFRMLVAGDLTGGGSNTDAVEAFYAPRIALDTTALGVDVLHAGHHGRNTSSSLSWVDRWLPNDGLSRNVVMGISTAHLGSPHSEVLRTLSDADRLKSGRMWTTRIALGGATHPLLQNANGGHVLIATMDHGARYVIQTVSSSGQLLQSQAFYSLRTCSQP